MTRSKKAIFSLALGFLQCSYARIPVALENFGNSCYTNAAIQVMSNMSNLSDLLIKNEKLFSNTALISSYIALVKNSASKQDILDALKNFYTIVGNMFAAQYHESACGQQTAAEVCDLIVGELASNSTKVFSKELDALINWQQESTVADARNISRKKSERNFKILLPLKDAEERIISHLQDALIEFQKKEKLDKCLTGLTPPCTKQLQLVTSAQYLLCELQRTGYSATYELIKYEHPVTIPLTLTLNRAWFAGEISPSQLNYELIGIITHGGGATSGHYTAYIKNQYEQPSHWYYCNDSSITNLGIQLSASELEDIYERATFVVYQRSTKQLEYPETAKLLEQFYQSLDYIARF